MNLSTFPIRILAERTGVPPSTIRAWERRYGILQAQRTACGHRHYTDDDVALIKRLQQRISRGATISKAIRELDALQHVINGFNQQEPNVNSQQWQHMVMELLEAINNFDTYKLDETYQEALSLYSVDVVTEKILRPTLVALGKRWPNGATSVAEEHFFSTYLRNKIGAKSLRR
jgi:DNA-binding transcriptional MerR regulator